MKEQDIKNGAIDNSNLPKYVNFYIPFGENCNFGLLQQSYSGMVQVWIQLVTVFPTVMVAAGDLQPSNGALLVAATLVIPVLPELQAVLTKLER